MSYDKTWNIEKYRDEHESDEHWEIRRAFMIKWKDDYPEERLVCLARVFCNIELLGCKYPIKVMNEVAALSKEVAQSYRMQRKTKLQRTFVSASDAAVDRARGVKREGGIIKEAPPVKSTRIQFVKQGESIDTSTQGIQLMKQGESSTQGTQLIKQGESSTQGTQLIKQGLSSTQDAITIKNICQNSVSDNEVVNPKKAEIDSELKNKDESTPGGFDSSIYLNELLQLPCLNVLMFSDHLFNTPFGMLVLLIRPWTNKLGNIQASCQACHVPMLSKFENHLFSISVNNKLLAVGSGVNKQEARQSAEEKAWNVLKTNVISVLIKEQWIAQDDTRIGVNDVSGQPKVEPTFGTPIESSVASKMMKLMGWKGGGLGAESQGIAEPIKPNLQMVNRAGLGSCSDLRTLKRDAEELMQRYLASSSLDVDLVFSADFSKDERAALHHTAQRQGLTSKSYGSAADSATSPRCGLKSDERATLPQVAQRQELTSKSYENDADRFLVVKKKLNPFTIVRAAIQEGGNTAKYQVFIPLTLGHKTGFKQY